MAQHAADKGAGQVALERPRRVGVAHHIGQVGHASEHHALVAHGFANLYRLAVHAQSHAAKAQQVQAGGGNHHVCRQQGARAQADAFGLKRGHGVGHHVGPAALDGGKQIAVGQEADALVPGLVARAEVGLGVKAGGQGGGGSLHDAGLGQVWPALGQAVEKQAQAHIFPARERIGQALGQEAAQCVGQRIRARARHHVGGRTLQHGHLRRLLCQRGHQRHGGSTAANHHHALIAHIQIGRPVLRVHHAPGKLVLARKGWGVTVGVVVVAAAHQQKAAAHLQGRLACAPLDCE